MQVSAHDTLRLVFWELTARCNLHCRHCRAEAQDSFAAGELSTVQLCRVASDIRDTGDPILVLTGGEPLQRDDFFYVAATCTRLFSRVALATNGTLIDAGVAEKIARVGIQRVSISFDGASPVTHDAFRGAPGSFAAALEGLSALRSAGVSVQANVTVTRHNVEELPRILQLMLDLGVDAFHVFMLIPVGCGAELSADIRLSPEEHETVLTWLFEQSVVLANRLHIKATCAPTYYRIMRQVARRKGIIPPAQGTGMHAVTRGCLAGSSVCFISRTGDVQPCGYLPVVAGNVLTEPFADIWRSAGIFHTLRDPNRLTGACRQCGYREVCQGCRARAYANTGDYLAAESDCLYGRSLSEKEALCE